MYVDTRCYDRDRGWSSPLPEADSPSTLVLVFGASDYLSDQGPIREIADRYRSSVVVGCSTAGEISGTTLSDGSLTVAVARFEQTPLRVAFESVQDGSDVAGRRIADQLSGPDLRAVLVLSEGSTVNGTGLVGGLQAKLPAGVKVFGGLAGDGDDFERTWVCLGADLSEDGVVAVGFYGPSVSFGCGSRGGWDTFGPERTVTRSSGNVVFELDGEPALDLYRRYLGDLSRDLPASALLFPLLLRTDDNPDGVVRTILAIADDEAAMTFAGDVPEGTRVQLMRTDTERLVDGAADAACFARRDAREATNDVLAIGISCVGRRLVLGERADEELDAVLDVLPDAAELIGFYSYGELSPLANGACGLHNQTMTVTTIGEVAA